MAIFVESAEPVTARVTLRNGNPEQLTFQVAVALTPAGTANIVAQSPVAELVLAAGASKTLDLGLSAPPTSGSYDSYVLGLYKAPDGTWKPAMANKAFEGVQVYIPGLEVVSVTWV